MYFLKFFYFIFLFVIITGCKSDYNFFPHDQGMIWDYKVLIGSDYTRTIDEKRLTITNIKTNIMGKGISFSKLYSNGNLFTYFKDNQKQNLSRTQAYLVDGAGFEEPVSKIMFPSINFNKKEWTSKSQLFITKGFQPPLRDFIPSPVFNLSLKIVDDNVDIRVKAGTFKNCIFLKGKGNTEFIGDTRSKANKVEVTTEEWICPGVGSVKEKRVESTNSSAFGTRNFYKELINFKN